eukprot:4427465-Amphidinium_carterae.1
MDRWRGRYVEVVAGWLVFAEWLLLAVAGLLLHHLPSLHLRVYHKPKVYVDHEAKLCRSHGRSRVDHKPNWYVGQSVKIQKRAVQSYKRCVDQKAGHKPKCRSYSKVSFDHTLFYMNLKRLEPIFYELFLENTDGTLVPVPVRILNTAQGQVRPNLNFATEATH